MDKRLKIAEEEVAKEEAAKNLKKNWKSWNCVAVE